ncbi:predicted protein [Sclerotinia sclerotiorum 1980 UF-70]|uniref:Uncharacterized protein n=1 Tax=Sclerotinia sclerotiorum (strain ATCC 18683 / 1980 / Ss-1) TaxID=665079 RepID=A7F3V1_SCLS1|nr:predicted protein [Sclerotinia sclerotiorum 1980 UF-70]EDN97422.1 predicted protein [Sclerotinia sclerotiorum 1980 UF-70]
MCFWPESPTARHFTLYRNLQASSGAPVSDLRLGSPHNGAQKNCALRYQIFPTNGSTPKDLKLKFKLNVIKTLARFFLEELGSPTFIFHCALKSDLKNLCYEYSEEIWNQENILMKLAA